MHTTNIPNLSQNIFFFNIFVFEMGRIFVLLGCCLKCHIIHTELWQFKCNAWHTLLTLAAFGVERIRRRGFCGWQCDAFVVPIISYHIICYGYCLICALYRYCICVSSVDGMDQTVWRHSAVSSNPTNMFNVFTRFRNFPREIYIQLKYLFTVRIVKLDCFYFQFLYFQTTSIWSDLFTCFMHVLCSNLNHLPKSGIQFRTKAQTATRNERQTHNKQHVLRMLLNPSFIALHVKPLHR